MPDQVGIAGRRRKALIILAVALAVITCASVLAFVAPRSKLDQGRLAGTLLTVALCVGASVACVSAWKRPVWRIAAVCGIMLSPASLVVVVLLIWDVVGWPARHMLDTPLALSMGGSILMAYICLLSWTRLNRCWLWVRAATIMLAVLLVLWIVAIAAGDLDVATGLPLLAVLSVLTAAGTLGVLLLHWRHSWPQAGAGITTRFVLTLTCPRCGETQELPAGRAQCRICRLTFRIEIEEEYCAKCGYLLYRLTSDRCPECGTPTFAAASARVTQFSAPSVTATAAASPEFPASDPPPAG